MRPTHRAQLSERPEKNSTPRRRSRVSRAPTTATLRKVTSSTADAPKFARNCVMSPIGGAADVRHLVDGGDAPNPGSPVERSVLDRIRRRAGPTSSRLVRERGSNLHARGAGTSSGPPEAITPERSVPEGSETGWAA
jgi:hypothetical protein